MNTLRTSSAVAIARNKKIEQEMIDSGLLQPPPAVPPVVPAKRDSFASTSSKTDGKSDEEEEGLRLRLEAIGVHVGSNIAER